jgi:hypothetical protein
LDIVRKYKLHKMDSWNESFDSILTIMTKFLSTQNQYSSLVQVLIWINIATRWGGGNLYFLLFEWPNWDFCETIWKIFC